MRPLRALVLSLVVVGIAIGCRAPTPAAELAPSGPVYPGAPWETVADPMTVGWSAAGLDSVRTAVSRLQTTGLVVVHRGKIILSYGDIVDNSYLASVRKSILSMMYGIFAERGKIRLDASLAELGIDDIQGLSAKEREATTRDLLGARSGVYHPAANAGDNLASAPPRGSQQHGTYQLYSNWDFNALGTIFEQETGLNIYDALTTELAQPLGFEDWDRSIHRRNGDTTQSRHMAYHMNISARDLARIGLLMLYEGKWKEKQIVPRDWVKLSTSAITPVTQMNPANSRNGRFGYGYLWWVYDGPRNSGAYEGAYSANGAYGQYITVIPKLDLVITHKTRINPGNRSVSGGQYFGLVDRIVAAAPGGNGPWPERWDLLIRNGTIVDGTGAPSYRGDIAVLGEKIVHLSRTPLDASKARRVIDADGLVVSPGFIDLHAHLEPLLQMPTAESHVRQGVTTALGGPDGGGPWPFKAYLDSAARIGLGMNVAYLIGHNTIRREVMGTEDRAPTSAELQRMAQYVRQGMGEGAFGLSTGLRYVPGYYSKTDEVIALARAAADSNGIYTSHLREEGLGLLEGVGEAIRIAQDARIPVVLTHHKAVGRQMWGKSATTLAMVDHARATGLDVMIDQYPYTASSTALSVLIPPWALAGGTSALRARVENKVLRDSIERGIIEYILNDRGGGDLRRVQFGRVSWDKSLEGRTLHDWAVERKMPTTPESAASLVIEGELRGGASMIYHIIDEGDVRRIMAHPQTMIASDGRLARPGEGVPHPRAYGTFPRVLGHYVRDEKVLTLEQAVQKMTGMPAKRLGLSGQRGCLSAGCFADLTLFDPKTIRDPATFTKPHQYPEGIPYVFVNGVPMVDGGTFTALKGGRVLKRH